MKKGFKITVAVLLFILSAGMISTVWFIDHDSFDNGLEYLIYMIGYGDASANATVRLILAIMGVLMVGVFSSYITVIFIEQKSKLKIGRNIYVDTESGTTAYIDIQTKHWELYDIEAKIIWSLNGATYEETLGRFSYWQGNQKTRLDVNLERGSVLYWYMQALYDGKSIEDVIIKIDFVNGKNNQSYSAINKYSLDSNFYINGEKRYPGKDELEKICGLNFDLSSMTVINDRYIKYESIFSSSDFCEPFSEGVCVDVDLTKSDGDEFGMLLFSMPFNGNWEFFKNEGYELSFKLFCTADMDLQLEIKSEKEPKLISKELRALQCVESIRVKLSDYGTDSLRNIKEMCFTVFNRENSDKKGRFYILDCCMKKG